MPESPGLYQRLTVTENLEYFARLYGLPRRRERIPEALAAVGLADRAHDLAGRLSKGLRQRAALARSLLNDPAVMFLDEPTSGLDPVATHEVHGLIAGLRDRGVTVFLTTHRLEEAERLCDRVAIMSTSLRTIGRPRTCGLSCSPRRWRSRSPRRWPSPAVSSAGCRPCRDGKPRARRARARRAAARRTC